MTVTPTVSLRLSLATQERLRQARQPGESQDALISRALDALQARESPQDRPTGVTPHDALASRLDALQARIVELEVWRESLVPTTRPGAVHLQHNAGQDSAPGAVQLQHSATQDVAQNVVQPATQAPGAYPLEVKRLALAMQDQGRPNRIIGQAILERTGRRPDSKNMTALLKSWRKTLTT